MMPSGDILYRSIDAGVSFTPVLFEPDPIQNVVIRDAQNVYVSTLTQSGPQFIGGPSITRPTAGCRSRRCRTSRSCPVSASAPTAT